MVAAHSCHRAAREGTLVPALLALAVISAPLQAQGLDGTHQLQPTSKPAIGGAPAIERRKVHVRHCQSVVYVTQYGTLGPVQSQTRAPLFATRTLNAKGQYRVTLSLR